MSILTPLKTCNRCGIEKPLEDFALRSSATKGLVPRLWCKECDVPQGMTAEASRRKQLMKLYGLTSEQFQAMGEAQKWQCAICHDDIQAKPYVDHNHATGKVRLLLCFRCNVGLGHFRDSTVFLQAAIDYLILEEKKADLRSSNSFERGN